jgi:WD40 repeat protein
VRSHKNTISIWVPSTPSRSWTRTGGSSLRRMTRRSGHGISTYQLSSNTLLSHICILCRQSPFTHRVGAELRTREPCPLTFLHHLEKYFAAQSLDNQILIYSTDNFRQNRKKRFAGHSVAGYACQVGFSPDGKWISSGDGEGNVVFWDWKTGRIKSRLKAHSKVVIAHEWLPHETVSSIWLVRSLYANPASVKSHYSLLGWAHQTMGRLTLIIICLEPIMTNLTGLAL